MPKSHIEIDPAACLRLLLNAVNQKWRVLNQDELESVFVHLRVEDEAEESTGEERL